MGWTFSNSFRSPALTVWDWRCLKDFEDKKESLYHNTDCYQPHIHWICNPDGVTPLMAYPSKCNSTSKHIQDLQQNCCNFWTNDALYKLVHLLSRCTIANCLNLVALKKNLPVTTFCSVTNIFLETTFFWVTT